MELDSASLIVHRDSSSFISRWSDNFSKISIRFDFDRDLFITHVYERAFRNFMRGFTSRRSDLALHDIRVTSTTGQNLLRRRAGYRPNFLEIDQNFYPYKERRSNDRKVLLLGDAAGRKSWLLINEKIMRHQGFPGNERLQYKEIIRQNVLHCIGSLLEAMSDLNARPEWTLNYGHHDFLIRHLQDLETRTELNPVSATAINALWEDPCLKQFRNSHLTGSVPS